MLLIVHVALALGSIVAASAALIIPSRQKLLASYGLVAGALLTGTVLAIRTHASMAHACVTGILYLSSVSVLAIAAENRLRRSSR